MISKLDKLLWIGQLLILVAVPSQYSINIGSIHLSPADPLIWLTAAVWGIIRLVELRENCNRETARNLLPPIENIAFLVLISLSLIKAIDKFAAIKELIQLTEYSIIIFLIYTRISCSREKINKLLYLFFILTTVIVSLGMYHYFDSARTIFAVKSTFGNRNILGGFLAISLPLMLAALLLIKQWSIRIWLAAVISCGLIICLSGASFVAIILGGLLVCLRISRYAVWGWTAYISLLFCLLLPHTPRANSEIQQKSICIYDENNNVAPRYTEWQASLEMWNEEPLLGVGVGNYQQQIGMFYGILPMPPGAKEADHNNLFLVTLSATGIIGLAGLLAMLACWFRQTTIPVEIKSDTLHRIIAIGVSGALLAFSINSIWSALLVRGVFPCLAIITALLYSFEKQAKNQEKPL